LIRGCEHDESKLTLANNLPEPAKVTVRDRRILALDAKVRTAEIMNKVAAIEAITESDLKVCSRSASPATGQLDLLSVLDGFRDLYGRRYGNRRYPLGLQLFNG
jgi:hypothetical protein